MPHVPSKISTTSASNGRHLLNGTSSNSSSSCSSSNLASRTPLAGLPPKPVASNRLKESPNFEYKTPFRATTPISIRKPSLESFIINKDIPECSTVKIPLNKSESPITSNTVPFGTPPQENAQSSKFSVAKNLPKLDSIPPMRSALLNPENVPFSTSSISHIKHLETSKDKFNGCEQPLRNESSSLRGSTPPKSREYLKNLSEDISLRSEKLSPLPRGFVSNSTNILQTGNNIDYLKDVSSFSNGLVSSPSSFTPSRRLSSSNIPPARVTPFKNRSPSPLRDSPPPGIPINKQGNFGRSKIGLPPIVPGFQKKYTSSRGLDVPSKKPVDFQSRPLKEIVTTSYSSPRYSMTRSPSPSLSLGNSTRLTALTPRRIYPQLSNDSADSADDLTEKDDAAVVFDANLTFVLGTKGKMRQNFLPKPAHQERKTASSALSNKISRFLQKTDHVMDEWQRVGRKGKEDYSLQVPNNGSRVPSRSRSATNIMIKGFQYFSRSGSTPRSTSRCSVRNDDIEDDCTEAGIDELSEMTADLVEENSTATLAADRLDVETSERLRLERELTETKHRNKELQQASERLELELLYARSDLNGICEDEEEGDGDGVYKQRYENAKRELEFTKRRLQQQHEDDLEQLVGLKKQLEKKLSDAYEETEEQRQVVSQWKRKVQKLNGEMNDLKLLLEEQNSRNNLLEKKQRKYDSESQLLHDELKKERQTKDRLAREKEVYMAEKYHMESTLADIKLELELKEEKFNALQREFDEITCGGKTEEEVTVLRKQKIDCERRLQDQEEELDELAGQVQLLEQAKLRLEMTLEQMRKEAKKQAQISEEELEEARCNSQKKIKGLEQQLENEHEERTQLLREKHELERRLQQAAEIERSDRAGDEALMQRLKRDLKRTKALLRDTQAQLERQKAEIPSKNLIRQLRNQLEDLECARAMAVKTKQSLENELLETQAQLDEANKNKSEAEDKYNVTLREKSELQSQVEENEEELAEVLKKYKSAVQQMSLDQSALQEQVCLVSELEMERNNLKEQLAELTTRLESIESMGGASSNLLYKRSELKVKELESKLELEQTTKTRMETQIVRLKETVEKLQNEISTSRMKEAQAQELVRKLQRQIRELKEELNKSLAKESEVIIKKKELEKKCETLEHEASTTRTDLRLALKRIEDLQNAIQGEMEDSISDHSESDEESFGSDESVNTFLSNHKISPRSEKGSLANDIRRLSSSTSRSSTSSNLNKDSSYA